MEVRVRDLEKGHAVIVERIGGLDKRMDDGFKAMSGRFDDLNKKIDKLPSEWAMARVVFYVTAALMAAAVFGPRFMAAIGQ